MQSACKYFEKHKDKTLQYPPGNHHNAATADTFCSPRENYFGPAGQNVQQAFKALSDILIPMPVIFLSS